MLQVADPGDLPFADVAISAQCDGLVTCNTRHFRGLDSTGVAVWTPSEFLEFYASSV